MRVDPQALRRWALRWHRDLGFACAALVLAYALSGLALNHVDDWDPDFVLDRRTLVVPAEVAALPVGAALYRRLDQLAGQPPHRVADQPTPTQVKLYYERGSLQVRLDARSALLERLERRPLFFQTNVLHRNSLRGWRWVADALALALIALVLTGVVIPAGRRGLRGRGGWLLVAGLVPPVLAVVLYDLGG
jgi:hypothetical protein